MITRVKTSIRPVELLGFAAAERSCRQGDAFLKFGDVDAARLQHGPGAEVDRVQAEGLEPLADGAGRAGQEARPDPVGPRAEPQIEARGLDLVRREGRPAPGSRPPRPGAGWRPPVGSRPATQPCARPPGSPSASCSARLHAPGRPRADGSLIRPVFRLVGEDPPGERDPRDRGHEGQARETVGERGNQAGNRIIAAKTRMVSVPSARPTVK